MSSISNAFALIKKAVKHQAEGLNFTELNRDTNIPQGSAHRLVKELVELKILDFDPARKTYKGGLALASLGAQIVEHYDLREVARPALQKLHRTLGHVVTLGIRDGDHGIYIDKIESQEFGLRLHSEIGKAFPLHCTAMGKVLLAHCDQKTRKPYLKKKLRSYTANTITTAEELEQELDSVLKNGFAIDNEEITRGQICIAAPIYGSHQEVVGAISCTSPNYVIEEQGIEPIAAQVLSVASEISI